MLELENEIIKDTLKQYRDSMDELLSLLEILNKFGVIDYESEINYIEQKLNGMAEEDAK